MSALPPLSRPHRHTHAGYVAELDGLRALAILLVIVSHLGIGHGIPGGFGVTVFFFISGFIITRLLLQEYGRYQALSWRHFYLRRLLRLGPALLFFIGLAYLCERWLMQRPVPLADVLASLFYWANYHLIYGGYAAINAQPASLQIVWSLAVEEHFYVLFPVWLWWLGRDRPTLPTLCQRLQSLSVWLLVLVLLWRCYLVYGVGLDALPHNRLYLGSDTRLDSIVWGVWLAAYQAQIAPAAAQAGGPLRGLPAWSRALALGLALAALLISFVVRDEGFRQAWRYSLQGLALLVLLAWLLWPVRPGVASQSEARPVTGRLALMLATWRAQIRHGLQRPVLVYIGKLSYSLYLFHWLARCLSQWATGQVNGWQHDGLMLMLAFSLAMLSYHGLEQPLLRWRQRWARV
ncbi:acyltransferase family protein [Parvibium lacunae]|uniref:Acyltransferase n=1 Tax=Parvibium lacunae TaxID=1888893 RepID=A0A368KZI6_9BURK|nr:acyltransferase [Parvibium lacunae]RCS56728.1 acyltransferase [Parvibium lacunae]